MAKKKRNSPPKGPANNPAAPGANPSMAAADRPAKVSAGVTAAKMLAALPGEISRGDWTVIIFALMMFFAPALGVPHEEMLQDTLKSIIVSFMGLGALLLFFWRQRNRREAVRWPLALFFTARSSHSYRGTVASAYWS